MSRYLNMRDEALNRKKLAQELREKHSVLETEQGFWVELTDEIEKGDSPDGMPGSQLSQTAVSYFRAKLIPPEQSENLKWLILIDKVEDKARVAMALWSEGVEPPSNSPIKPCGHITGYANSSAGPFAQDIRQVAERLGLAFEMNHMGHPIPPDSELEDNGRRDDARGILACLLEVYHEHTSNHPHALREAASRALMVYKGLDEEPLPNSWDFPSKEYSAPEIEEATKTLFETLNPFVFGSGKPPARVRELMFQAQEYFESLEDDIGLTM